MSIPELPQDTDAEQHVLGAVFVNRDALIPIATWLTPEMFYQERHGQIYAAMLSCLSKRLTPDVRIVANELRQKSVELGRELPYLIELMSHAAPSGQIEYWAGRIERASVLRQLIIAGGKIAAIGYQSRDGDDACASAQSLLNDVRAKRGQTEIFKPIANVVDRYYEKMSRVMNGERSALGIQTGLRDLDEMTGGLYQDELSVIAARPAVGKTSFMLSVAHNIGRRNDADVLIASLEMSDEQLLVRELSMRTKIDSQRLRMMMLNDNEARTVHTALPDVAAMRVYIADIDAMTADQIRLAALRHTAANDRPCVVMIDYLQLLGSTRKRENRVTEVSDFSRSLKQLARELHMPVIALSQLSRAVEGRTSHVPMLSDLRESGSIEQDADNVWFIYREELYDKDTDKRGIAELHIAKHRQGPVGVVPMHFDAATTRFSDLTYRTVEGY